MKRIISILLALTFIVTALCLPASAEGLKFNNGTIKFNIYKADPAKVVKDGKIGDGEYIKLDTSTDPDETMLYIIFGRGANAYSDAMDMLPTMEYYFSWDEEHGLNLAVRCAPNDLVQLLDINKYGVYPEDSFLNNCALGISVSGELMPNDQADTLFYAIGKRTDDGRYLQGWYNQLGLNGDYTAEAEKDFIIEYTDDGYVTYEWSIPMEYFMSGTVSAGRYVYLSLFAMAGAAKEANYTDCYGISLGDRCYMRITTDSTRAAVGVLSSISVAEAKPNDPVGQISMVFSDTKDDAWYAETVLEMYNSGLMNGKGNGKFAPNEMMTRAEFVTLLYRNEGSPSVSYTKWHDDVPEGKWYTDAVIWASRAGLVTGYTDNTFRPDRSISRGELALLLYKYASYNRVKVTDAEDKLSSYPDSDSIKSYLYPAVVWATHAGLINGKKKDDGKSYLELNANATRAEIATVMFRYIEKYD